MKEQPESIGPERPERKSRVWWMLAFVVGMSLLYLVAVGPSGAIALPGEGKNHPAVGHPLRELRLAPLTGNAKLETLESLAGDVVLVNFWGTWCPPCLLEFPHLADLRTRLIERPGFQLLFVSCGPRDDRDVEELRWETQRFLNDKQFAIPTYYDPEFTTRVALAELTESFDMSYPTTVLLDGQGIVRGVWEGYAPGIEKNMEALVLEVLE